MLCEEGDVFGRMLFSLLCQQQEEEVRSDDDGDDEETSASLFTAASKWKETSQGREYGA